MSIYYNLCCFIKSVGHGRIKNLSTTAEKYREEVDRAEHRHLMCVYEFTTLSQHAVTMKTHHKDAIGLR